MGRAALSAAIAPAVKTAVIVQDIKIRERQRDLPKPDHARRSRDAGRPRRRKIDHAGVSPPVVRNFKFG